MDRERGDEVRCYRCQVPSQGEIEWALWLIRFCRRFRLEECLPQVRLLAEGKGIGGASETVRREALQCVEELLRGASLADESQAEPFQSGEAEEKEQKLEEKK